MISRSSVSTIKPRELVARAFLQTQLWDFLRSVDDLGRTEEIGLFVDACLEGSPDGVLGGKKYFADRQSCDLTTFSTRKWMMRMDFLSLLPNAYFVFSELPDTSISEKRTVCLVEVFIKTNKIDRTNMPGQGREPRTETSTHASTVKNCSTWLSISFLWQTVIYEVSGLLYLRPNPEEEEDVRLDINPEVSMSPQVPRASSLGRKYEVRYKMRDERRDITQRTCDSEK